MLPLRAALRLTPNKETTMDEENKKSCGCEGQKADENCCKDTKGKDETCCKADEAKSAKKSRHCCCCD
jgi:hypothetical protein